MHVVCKGFHIRKSLVALDVASCVALAFPTVIDVDVLVAGLLHATRDHGTCLFPNGRIRYLALKKIP